jgi:hypothetical protein
MPAFLYRGRMAAGRYLIILPHTDRALPVLPRVAGRNAPTRRKRTGGGKAKQTGVTRGKYKDLGGGVEHDRKMTVSSAQKSIYSPYAPVLGNGAYVRLLRRLQDDQELYFLCSSSSPVAGHIWQRRRRRRKSKKPPEPEAYGEAVLCNGAQQAVEAKSGSSSRSKCEERRGERRSECAANAVAVPLSGPIQSHY